MIFRPAIAPFHQKEIEQKGKGFYYKGKEFIHHSDLHHTESAFHRFSGLQIFIIGVLILDVILGLFINWHMTVLAFITLLTLLYFADLLFNLFIIIRSFSRHAEIVIADDTLRAIPDKEWPSYTVFCPLYKEWQVMPQFVAAMNKLDYPKDKLQIMLLLEEDDTETLRHILYPRILLLLSFPIHYQRRNPKHVIMDLNMPRVNILLFMTLKIYLIPFS